jgi:hypothetical protein
MLLVVVTSRLGAALVSLMPRAELRSTILARGPAALLASRSDLAAAQLPSRPQGETSACGTAATVAGMKKRDDTNPPIHPRQSPTASAPPRSASWIHCADAGVGSGTANSSRRGGLIS